MGLREALEVGHGPPVDFVVNRTNVLGCPTSSPRRHKPLPPRPDGRSVPASGGGNYDAIVVGGGHNGLTTGAYLARAGLRALILERRHILGGACVTEEVWPGARVSRASYVVSMLQPKVVADLRLEGYGYRAIPLDPAYAAITEQGPIVFFNDVEQTASRSPSTRARTPSATRRSRISSWRRGSSGR